MRLIRQLSAGTAVGLLLLLASCARRPLSPPAAEPAAASVQAEAPAAPPSKSLPPPAGKKTASEPTIIPDEERRTVREAAFAEAEAVKDSSTLTFEEALTRYEEAKSARERGDFEAAIQSLDDAYGILLKIPFPAADSTLEQEKENLRLLIAQRIQEIYASRRNPVVGNHRAIPLEDNPWVRKEINSFLGPERKVFEEAYRRSGFYRDWIREELRRAGLPEELVWLPVVESSFSSRALSSARALGLWQFIRSTGLRYGLNQDKYIDERMDPYKSTKAAIRYLEDLHSYFGDWTTALAGYNCGEGFVQRVIKTQNINYLDNFWDLFARLPYQTARYVPRFIAVTLIIQNPEAYGLRLPEPYPPLRFDTVTVNHPAQLQTLAAAAGFEAAELEILNPELRQKSTPDRAYDLRVPVGGGERLLAA
ncbi:MAG: lytic transglycosylase domain-containing protein, partial [Candidatus Aminicenantes bacterium]|nr:lytic transglycosylase domain-containing protein [Candidatus Aminicenantes bacterium]